MSKVARESTRSGDWVMNKGFPTFFACWAFVNGILWMAGMLEFESAVIYMLFMMVVLQLFSIDRGDGG